MNLLVHPPFADPTQPYVSLPTLKGALRARGLDVRVVDLNIEATHWLLAPETIEALADRVATRFAALDRAPSLAFEEQRELVRLADARRLAEQLLAAEPSPLEAFRSERLFYDPVQYSWARRRVDALFEVLGAAHFPFRFGFNHASHNALPWSFDLLADYASGKSPLDGFYRRWVSSHDARFVGLSVVFPSQVPEALALAHAIRALRPGTFVALGGPCIHQIAVHLDVDLQRRLLGFVDAVALFEGEETLAQLLPRLEGACFETLKDVPNLLVMGPDGAPHLGPRHVLDLRDAPAPDYSDLDLDRYLAPSRTVLYAPTRGCYWGKCSFCYYGLAETATASYREVPPAVAAAQLGELCERTGARHVYLSCDVLSPSYAVRLAQALVDQSVDITWSSDLKKIERWFTPERCELLHRAGLRAAAFGIESGSDRILALIRKGTDRATMTAVNRAFHDAGIATEWMTFTDHPDESVDEALETVDWIAAEADAVDLFIVGRFGLERGSHIAQEPQKYGVQSIYYAAGDDLRLYALFSQQAGPRSPADATRVDAAITRVGAPYALHPYPWAGANSTHHTLLHFLRFGQRAFRTHFQSAGDLAETLPRAPAVTALRGRPRYDIEALREAEARFFERYLARALYTTLPGQGVALAPLSQADYAAATQGVPPAIPKRARA